MMALEQAREYLEQLGLTEAAAALDNRLDLAAQRKLSYPEVLSDLLGIEAAARRERYLKTRTRLAHLPFHRTLEEFDFGFQPSIDESQVRELASLTFVSQAANLVLLGPPGVGKTHLAVALGLEAISRGYGAYCPASTIFASLASISFAGSPPRPGPVAGLHRCGSWGRQIPG